MFRWILKRLLGGCLSLFIFSTNALLAHAAESNFWAERRHRLQRNEAKKNGPLKIASLAANPADVLSRFPSLDNVSPSPSLSAFVLEDLPQGFAREHAALLQTLSSRFGSVRKVIPGRASGPVVVHIQDVHHNEDAQKNIAAVVQSVAESGMADILALEGAFEPINLSGLRAFPRRDILRKIADYLLRVHKISGPIHAALTGEKSFPAVVGVDDPAHYQTNVDAYRRSAPMTAKAKETLSALRAEADRRKGAVFNPELVAFDREAEAYRGGKIGLGEYLKALSEASSKTGLPVESGIKGFLAAFEVESSLDFKRVEAERARLVEELVKKLDKSSTEALVQWSAAYRTGEIRYADFYQRLKGLCGAHGLPLSNFPAMDAYVRYVLLSDRIDAEELMKEMAALEKAVYERLARTPEEKRLVEEFKRQSLAAKLVDFSLSPEEWAEYAAPHRRLDAGPAGMLKIDLSSFESFYQEAHARDQAMVDNLLKAVGRRRSAAGSNRQPTAKEQQPVTILVTGGYHSPGIQEKLREAGASVISFAPRIEKLDAAQGSAYLSVFTREKTPMEKIFQGRKLFLPTSPVESLTEELVPMVAGYGAVSKVLETKAERTVREWETRGGRKELEEHVEKLLESFVVELRKNLGADMDFSLKVEELGVRAVGKNIEATVRLEALGFSSYMEYVLSVNPSADILTVEKAGGVTPEGWEEELCRPYAAPAAQEALELAEELAEKMPGQEWVTETTAGLFRAAGKPGEKAYVLNLHRRRNTSLTDFMVRAVQVELFRLASILDSNDAVEESLHGWTNEATPYVMAIDKKEEPKEAASEPVDMNDRVRSLLEERLEGSLFRDEIFGLIRSFNFSFVREISGENPAPPQIAGREVVTQVRFDPSVAAINSAEMRFQTDDLESLYPLILGGLLELAAARDLLTRSLAVDEYQKLANIGFSSLIAMTLLLQRSEDYVLDEGDQLRSTVELFKASAAILRPGAEDEVKDPALLKGFLLARDTHRALFGDPLIGAPLSEALAAYDPRSGARGGLNDHQQELLLDAGQEFILSMENMRAPAPLIFGAIGGKFLAGTRTWVGKDVIPLRIASTLTENQADFVVLLLSQLKPRHFNILGVQAAFIETFQLETTVDEALQVARHLMENYPDEGPTSRPSRDPDVNSLLNWAWLIPAALKWDHLAAWMKSHRRVLTLIGVFGEYELLSRGGISLHAMDPFLGIAALVLVMAIISLPHVMGAQWEAEMDEEPSPPAFPLFLRHFLAFSPYLLIPFSNSLGLLVLAFHFIYDLLSMDDLAESVYLFYAPGFGEMAAIFPTPSVSFDVLSNVETPRPLLDGLLDPARGALREDIGADRMVSLAKSCVAAGISAEALRAALIAAPAGAKPPVFLTMLVKPGTTPEELKEMLNATHLLHGDTPIMVLTESSSAKKGKTGWEFPADLAEVMGARDFPVAVEPGELFLEGDAFSVTFLESSLPPEDRAPAVKVFLSKGLRGDQEPEGRLKDAFVPWEELDGILERFKELSDFITRYA